MRIRMELLVAGAGFCAVLFLVLYRQTGDALSKVPHPDQSAVAAPADNAAAAAPAAAPGAEATRAREGAAEAAFDTNSVLEDSPEEKHQAYVTSRIDELSGLAMESHPASLDIICSELSNRDSAIRKAALDAVVQFGSRTAIPKLLDAATQTDDAHEKAAIMDAVAFLKLPSVTEVQAQAEAAAQETPIQIPPGQ